MRTPGTCTATTPVPASPLRWAPSIVAGLPGRRRRASGMPMRVLRQADDGAVDHRANGQRQAGQGHDVDRVARSACRQMIADSTDRGSVRIGDDRSCSGIDPGRARMTSEQSAAPIKGLPDMRAAEWRHARRPGLIHDHASGPRPDLLSFGLDLRQRLRFRGCRPHPGCSRADLADRSECRPAFGR